jgi:hypothetical protein
MLHLASGWNTISSLAIGLGTLVLVVATFAPVRSVQKILFVERHWVPAEGGRGVAERMGPSRPSCE